MRQLDSKPKGWMAIVLAVVGLMVGGMWDGVPAEDVAPTIEELTDGKIKVGDLVTKENVELVKEHLPVGIYECVKQGMVLEMGQNVAPWATVPKWFREITKKNHEIYGDPVVDENSVIYTKDGKPWPGGTPFPEPEGVAEVVANLKYDRAMDDFRDHGTQQLFVNKEGKAYKNQGMWASHTLSQSRLTTPPLGTPPGMEKEYYRNVILLTRPLELKGTGQLQIRAWDDGANPDKGFVYVPAFKRILRISATTYQDNMGGSDFTWGDPGGGYLEPFRDWNSALAGIKNILVPEPFGEESIQHRDGTVDIRVPWDEGRRFPRVKWVVAPVYLVEMTPKIKHVYGKKVLYQLTLPFSNCWIPIQAVDFYDRQLKLWKGFLKPNQLKHSQGERFSMMISQHMFDIQAGHSTHLLHPIDINCGEYHPEDLTLKLLISKGR
jgi:hypothetical protein